jgi:hypothetical protein
MNQPLGGLFTHPGAEVHRANRRFTEDGFFGGIA